MKGRKEIKGYSKNALSRQNDSELPYICSLLKMNSTLHYTLFRINMMSSTCMYRIYILIPVQFNMNK